MASLIRGATFIFENGKVLFTLRAFFGTILFFFARQFQKSRTVRMRWVFFVFVALIFSARPVPAAELVMFESSTCDWCMVWDEEVGVVYDKTKESRVAPLRRIDIDDPRPPELQDLQQIIYTPTFVLMDNGREVGRIIGYPGESYFWEILQALISRLPAQAFGCDQRRIMASDESAPTKENRIC